LKEAGTRDQQDPEIDELLGVTDFFGKEEKEATCDENHGKEVGSESEEEKKDATEISSGRPDEIGFGLLGRLGVEGKILGIEGEKREKKKNACPEDGQGDHLLAEAGAGGGGFGFGHG
jgi:hypothetical protein